MRPSFLVASSAAWHGQARTLSRSVCPFSQKASSLKIAESKYLHVIPCLSICMVHGPSSAIKSYADEI